MKNQSWIFDTELDRFEQDVLEMSHQRPVLVDFWADWCGPCRFLDPVLKEAIDGYEGQVMMAKLEVDEGENMKLAGRYAVRGFPTIILFRDGEEQGRFSGAKPLHFVEDFIHHHGELD